MKVLTIIAVALGLVLAVMMSNSLTGAHQDPVAIKPAPEPTKEQLAKSDRCRKFLASDHSGMIRYEWNAPEMAVEISPDYYRTSYDTKLALNGLLRCVATQGAMDDSISQIDYLDVRSHQSIATWRPATGLKVKDR